MAGSKGSEAAGAAVISRRDAIVGALALAAGSIVAASPRSASGLNGDPVTAGGSVYAAGGNTFYLMSNGAPTGTELAQAMVNRNGTGGSPIQAFGGVVMPAAPATSAGVWGFAWSPNHYGVHAEHDSADGTALKVEGKVELSRSGRATISKGSSSRTVTVASGVGTDAMIFATLQSSAGLSNHIRFVKRTSATTFKVYLTKSASSTVTFAWMIVG